MLEIAVQPWDRERDRKQGRRVSLIGLLALGALLLLLFRCESTNWQAFDNADDTELDASRFGIAGDTTEPMTPGTTVRVDLTVTNPHPVAMTVFDLTIAVARVTAPRADRLHPCTVDDFLVEQPAEGLRATVPAAALRSLSGLGVDRERWPRVGMVDRPLNQDGCKGALVTLSYAGSGTLRDR